MLTRIDKILSKLLTGYLEMSKPIGGRGKKAGYTTTHMRVPDPIKSEVRALISRFHEDMTTEPINLETSLEDAIVLAKSVLLQKKSARVSLEKLLTALYHTEIKLG